MKTNTPLPAATTHEGGKATKANAYQTLQRSVLSCFLWENEFYENGQSIANRIISLSQEVTLPQLSSLAIKARTEYNLRHVSLLLACCLAARTQGPLVGHTVYEVIQRADELAEIYALWAGLFAKKKGNKVVFSKQLQKGVAKAFNKFDAYQFAKYNRDGQFKLRDVLFLSHAKPSDKDKAELFKQIATDTLPVPYTWEVELSAGKDKKKVFTEMMEANKLPYMALLRNLRNMEQAGVDRKLMKDKIVAGNADRILPFRFVAAARACPMMEPELDKALINKLAKLPSFKGSTIVLVDVSGSMYTPLSAKSDMTRADAAATLAAIFPSDDLRVFTFSSTLREVPPRKGMACVSAIHSSQSHSSTILKAAIQELPKGYDRLIVITDEQSQDGIAPYAAKHKYLINVASYRNGVSYGNGYTHIDGFSENILRYIQEIETLN